jgi:phenylacetate-coenzyme A ligase PaaK-like adenylate-forming protein
LFNRKEKYGKNFFNDILEPLFYEALAQDRGGQSIYTKLNNVRMPFLNGGLFEPMNEYS